MLGLLAWTFLKIVATGFALWGRNIIIVVVRVWGAWAAILRGRSDTGQRMPLNALWIDGIPKSQGFCCLWKLLLKHGHKVVVG